MKARPWSASGKAGKAGKPSIRDGLPAVLQPDDNAPEIETGYGRFDIDDPELPEWIEKRAFRSAGYPGSTPPCRRPDRCLEPRQTPGPSLPSTPGQ